MFHFNGKEYRLNNQVILLKLLIPIITLLLSVLPLLFSTGFYMPINIYIVLISIFLVLNIMTMMIPWTKDTELYRIKDPDVDKFMNRLTTLNVYSISFIFMIIIASIVIILFPKDDYAKKHNFDTLKNYSSIKIENIDLNEIYFKKTDSVPVKDYSFKELKKDGYDTEKPFFVYYKMASDMDDLGNNIYHDYKKAVMVISKNVKEPEFYNADYMFHVGSVSTENSYEVIIVPESFFDDIDADFILAEP